MMKRHEEFRLITFGQQNPEFTYEDYLILEKLRRISNKHHRQAENDCNGYGVVKGQMYYSGLAFGQQPDDYERRTYGYGVKSAYLSESDQEDGLTVFDAESDRLYDQAQKIIKGTVWSIKTQGDPRGKTMRIFYRTTEIN